MFSDELREGQILAGKYRVDRELGAGGMGVVLAATHIELDQRVAIKVLKRDLAEAESVAERFRREARAACRIRSPHGARVIDVGTTDDGLPYMVMEYLDGHDLAAELERRGQLPYEEAASYVMQAADAICDAHDESIIHRDIKPANLFLTQRAGLHAVKVLDFGISKSLQDTNSSASPGLTHTQALIGSPMYMSPEQLDSPRTVDARTDIWSLGIVLYELVTGQPPFTGDGIAGLIKQIVADTPPRLANFGIDAPPEFEAIIDRCLAKKRDDRYASVRDLMLALAPFAKEPPLSMPMMTRASFGGRNAESRRGPESLPQPPAAITSKLHGTRVAVGTTPSPATPPPTLAGASREATTGASTTADRAVTPFAQSHTVAEAPKKSSWPLVAGAALVLIAGGAVWFATSNSGASNASEGVAVTPTTPVPDAVPIDAVSSVAQNGPATAEPPAASAEVAPSEATAELGNPAPSVSAAVPAVNVEPPVSELSSSAPQRPPARPGKRPAKQPKEEIPAASKPPSGVSDFGGRR